MESPFNRNAPRDLVIPLGGVLYVRMCVWCLFWRSRLATPPPPPRQTGRPSGRGKRPIRRATATATAGTACASTACAGTACIRCTACAATACAGSTLMEEKPGRPSFLPPPFVHVLARLGAVVTVARCAPSSAMAPSWRSRSQVLGLRCARSGQSRRPE